jgi:hypothetical protein
LGVWAISFGLRARATRVQSVELGGCYGVGLTNLGNVLGVVGLEKSGRHSGTKYCRVEGGQEKRKTSKRVMIYVRGF